MRRLALALALLPAPARAYQREDHYYTVRMVLTALRPRLEGDGMAAMCAQLADEAPELNAIAVYRRLMKHPVDYGAWILRQKGPVATVGHMVSVQQLLHGLTGGSPEGVRAVARAVVKDLVREASAASAAGGRERSDALCALGFGLHLYGDSFSHVMLRNPRKLYKTGIGHLFDSSFPDIPLYSGRRLKLWKDYVTSGPDLLPHSDQGELGAVLAAVEEHQRTAHERNGFNQRTLRRLFDDLLRGRGVEQAFLPFDRVAAKTGCQALADRQAAAYGLAPAPDCARAWSLFMNHAVREFDAYDAGAARDALSRDPAYLKVPYLKESPFSKGPNW